MYSGSNSSGGNSGAHHHYGGSRQSAPISMGPLPEHEPVEMDLGIQLPGDDPLSIMPVRQYQQHHLRVESEEMAHINDPELRRYKLDGIDSDGSSHIIVQLNNSRSNLPDPATFAYDGDTAATTPTNPASSSLSSTVASNVTSTTRTSSSRAMGVSDEVIHPGTPQRSQQQSQSSNDNTIDTTTKLNERQPDPSGGQLQQPQQQSSLTEETGSGRGGGVGVGGVNLGAFEKSQATVSSSDKTPTFLSTLELSAGLRRWFLIGILVLILVAGAALAGIICGTGHCASEAVVPTPPPTTFLPTTLMPTPVPSTAPVSTVSPTGVTTTTSPTAVKSTTAPTLITTTNSPTVSPTVPSTTNSPTVSPTIASTTNAPTTASPTASESSVVDSITPGPTSIVPGLSAETLAVVDDVNTPQGRAMLWISEYPGFAAFPDWRKQQLFAMATFYRSFNGNDWPLTRRFQWLDYTVNECEWRSIQTSPCSLEGKMEYLGLLNDPYLQGTMPPEVALLTKLEEISIVECGLPGTIDTVFPVVLAESLTNLRLLSFEGNALNGTLPTYLSALTNLQYLKFMENSFSGTIPTELGLLTELIELNLNTNNIVGTVPTELAALTKLVSLDISDTNLSGSIPAEVCNLPLLETITCSQMSSCCQ